MSEAKNNKELVAAGHEFARLMSRDTPIIDMAMGNRYAKDKQVARCGNAVPPPFAEALVRANLPEMCLVREVAA